MLKLACLKNMALLDLVLNKGVALWLFLVIYVSDTLFMGE